VEFSKCSRELEYAKQYVAALSLFDLCFPDWLVPDRSLEILAQLHTIACFQFSPDNSSILADLLIVALICMFQLCCGPP
jgi:hypothetical protein